MLCFHIAVIVFSLLICYKWGDWRHWQEYYPTILFFILGDFAYNIVFHDTMLWLYVSQELNHTLLDLLVAITVFPATVMLFLPHYPKAVFNQVLYIFAWVFLYIAGEYISYSLGGFGYCNGWNIAWSLLFNIILFPILYLHHKKPLLACAFILIELTAFILLFRVDLIRLP